MDNKRILATRSSAVSMNVRNALERLPQDLQHLKPRIVALINAHSDLQSFMNANSPKIQELCASDEKKAVMSSISPTLTVIEKSYGDGSAMIWLCQQLAEFNEFCGKKEKMDDWQIEQLARGIVTRYGQLKASEIMLFLYQYKMGKWGPLYGTVDPQEFMVVLERFFCWRARKVEEAEGEIERAKREAWAKRPGILKPDQIRALKERIMSVDKNLSQKK